MQPQTEFSMGGASSAVSSGVVRKGFVRSLFDLSFRHFVTGRVVAVLYVVSLVFVALNALFSAGYVSLLLGAFLSAVAESQAIGWISGVLAFLIGAPLLLFVSVVYVRVLLEIVVVLFRIAENTAEMARANATPAATQTTEARS